MRKQLPVIAAFAVLVLVGILWLLIWPPREPSYHGRKITSWLENYPHYKQVDWRESEAAMQSFGTNGIPYLFDFLRRGPPFVNQVHDRIWQNGPYWIARHLNPPHARFGLGYTPEIFALIGTNSIPSLCNVLNDQNRTVRFAAILSLRGFGPKAKNAIPALEERLKKLKQLDENPEPMWRFGPNESDAIVATIRAIDPEAPERDQLPNP